MPGSRPPASLRRAVLADADACARVHHASWVDTYSALLPAAHWDSDTVERRAEAWRHWLGNGADVTVAEVGGCVVGLAIAGPGRQVGDYPPVRDAEVHSLYVDADQHGTGVGQELLDAVVAPGAPAQLWVAELNPRARRFYERNGFRPDGARSVEVGAGLAQVRLVR